MAAFLRVLRIQAALVVLVLRHHVQDIPEHGVRKDAAALTRQRRAMLVPATPPRRRLSPYGATRFHHLGSCLLGNLFTVNSDERAPQTDTAGARRLLHTLNYQAARRWNEVNAKV